MSSTVTELAPKHKSASESASCFAMSFERKKKKVHETLKLLVGGEGEGQGIEVATKCGESVRY